MSVTLCRFQGPFKADSLQQFTADQLLKLPQVAPVQLTSLRKFLAKVPEHKVTVLAFSSSSKASMPLRRAAQQHELEVVVGRVHWNPEVTQHMPLLQEAHDKAHAAYRGARGCVQLSLS